MSFSSAKKILAIAVVFLFLAGCSRKKEAPDPPHAKGTLVVEMFSALKEKDYSAAAAKVKRLRMLNPNDVNLASIEYQIQVDSSLASVQGLLDNNKVEEAKKLTDSIVKKYGSREGLLDAQKTVNNVLTINKLIHRIQKAKTSSKIAIAAGELNRVIQLHKYAQPLKNYTEYSLDKARQLMSIEDVMAFNDLKADFDIANVAGDPIACTMMAQIAVEEPLDISAVNYERMMSENWKNNSQDNLYIKLEEEQLFFRRALVSKNNDFRQKIFEDLLTLPPGNFSSMLIRAFILNKKGYRKEGDALADIIDSDLGRKTRFSEYWFKAHPNVGNITNLKSVNPFVLYPFFVYYE